MLVNDLQGLLVFPLAGQFDKLPHVGAGRAVAVAGRALVEIGGRFEAPVAGSELILHEAVSAAYLRELLGW